MVARLVGALGMWAVQHESVEMAQVALGAAPCNARGVLEAHVDIGFQEVEQIRPMRREPAAWNGSFKVWQQLAALKGIGRREPVSSSFLGWIGIVLGRIHPAPPVEHTLDLGHDDEHDGHVQEIALDGQNDSTNGDADAKEGGWTVGRSPGGAHR